MKKITIAIDGEFRKLLFLCYVYLFQLLTLIGL